MKKICLMFISILGLFSCATFNAENPFPSMEICNYENNTAYDFKCEKSNKLIIYIEGTGWYSVLGWKEEKQWRTVNTGYDIIKLMNDEYNILIPERLNMQIGKYYLYNPSMRRNYTLENLIASYSSTINTYLAEHEYDSIILMGVSEGACLLPLIYKNITLKSNIKSIVSISYGGLSVYEQIKIIGESKLKMPDYYREACLSLDEYRKDIELHPDSIGELMGYTYSWWNSFKDYRPVDDYSDINMPILFVHGKLDIIVPVESTEYIQENLSNKPFEYIYLNGTGHYIKTKEGKKILENNVVKWINDHS